MVSSSPKEHSDAIESVLEMVIEEVRDEGDEAHMSSMYLRVGQLLDEYTKAEVVNNWGELMDTECMHCGKHSAYWGWTCRYMMKMNKKRRAEGEPEKVFCTDNCLADYRVMHQEDD